MLVGRARTTLSPSDSHHPLSLSFEDPSPSTSMTLPPAPFDPNAPPTREHDLRSRTSRTSLGASKKYLEESVDTDTGDAELVPLLGQSAYDLAGGSVFDDPELAGYYTPPDSYEGKHRFDPLARWTVEEEKAIVKKLDIKVCLFVSVCFAALQLDRGNIQNALADNLLSDLNLTRDDYNMGQTLFYACFLSMELPSQLISKWMGIDRWVPLQMVTWSLVAISQSQLTGRTGFLATRALLGALEGGFIPCIVLYLSYFYTAAELSIRLTFFWAALTVTTVLGAVAAAGILSMRGLHGLEGWRWLFLIEGSLTLGVGIFAALWFPASPTETAGGIRGAGWFTEREEIIIVNRVLRDDPTKSSMHNREGIGLRALWLSLSDFDLYPLYALGLTIFIAPHTIGAYFTLILKDLGFSTFETNLLTVLPHLLFIFGNLGLSFLSRRLKERSLVASIGSFWLLFWFIVLIRMPDNVGVWVKYGIITMIQSYPYAHPIIVGWGSANSGSVRTRSVSASVYNMSVQFSSIISSNIYRSDDAPYYHRGNRILIKIISLGIFLFFATKLYYIRRNATRRKIWQAKSVEQQQHYLRTTRDEGNRRLDFQFVH